MTISESTRKRLLTWLVAVIVGGIAGYVYVAFAYPMYSGTPAKPWNGFRAGLIIGGLTMTFELFVMRGRFGRWLQQQSFAVALLIREAILTVIVVGSLLFNVLLSHYLEGSLSEFEYPLWNLTVDTAFSFVITGVLIFMLQVRRLIGGRTFRNILIGRYHRPVREERIFAIFDLLGSTALAARLGDERFLGFLTSIFFDIDNLIVDYGGEAYTYVGDALIATWPLKDGKSNSRAVAAAAEVMRRAEALAPRYRRRFGTAPHFRAILHGGSVVIGECGDSHRQITYLGDVLNVASRLERLAKTLGADVLISSDLLSRTELPKGVSAVPAGSHELQGVARPVGVYRLNVAERSKTPELQLIPQVVEGSAAE